MRFPWHPTRGDGVTDGPEISGGDVREPARRPHRGIVGQPLSPRTSTTTTLTTRTPRMSKNRTQRYSETRRVERSFWTGKPTGTVHVTRRHY